MNNINIYLLSLSAIVFALLVFGFLAYKDSQNALLSIYVEKQKTGVGDLRGPLSRYINSCCSDKEAVVELAKTSEFTINIRTLGPDEVIDRGFGEEHYDEVIFAKRRTSILRFWDVLAIYKLEVFIKNNEIKLVNGKVERTLP
jgi:type IV secretory pathway TrbF-like protein